MSSEDLKSQGYCLLQNVYKKDRIQYAQSCFSEDRKVQYKKLEGFIYDTVIKCVDRNLGWRSVFTKYRASDNNNSSDAGAFHRDVIKYNRDPLEPFYTCLAYLDSTVMELIPKSHQDPFMTHSKSIDQIRNNTVQIRIEVGDLLVFHSTLLHRGIFTEHLPHRRLIQIFEVYPSQELFNRFNPEVIHIPATPLYSQPASALNEWIFKYETVGKVCNWFGFINAATGYGFEFDSEHNNTTSNHLVYSSEGTRPRLVVHDNGNNRWQPGNRYIIVQSTIRTVPEEQRDAIVWKLYTRQYYGYGGIANSAFLLWKNAINLCSW